MIFPCLWVISLLTVQVHLKNVSKILKTGREYGNASVAEAMRSTEQEDWGNLPHFENGTNCTNEYCVSDDEYEDLIIDHIMPTPFEWVLVAMHAVTFAVGLIGNALVCVAVYRNRAMRNVINYFIVNLAVADFLVILLCLPPTVLWDVTETWFLGHLLCKVILYFQTVSVAVSVLTLTFISVDRWYAICFPLQFRLTTTRAKYSIAVIWIASLMLDLPEYFVLETMPRQNLSVKTHYFTQCQATWSDEYEFTFQVLKMIFLYTLPLLFMSLAYFQIVRVLWTSGNIPGHAETINMTNNPLHSNNHTFSLHGNHRRIAFGCATESQLQSRRKAAKMLVAVVIMFAICYFPVHLISILRNVVAIDQTEFTAALSNLSHWLCYANSAVNPLIYNFMSGKFRREFKRAFQKCHDCKGEQSRDMISQNEAYLHSVAGRASQSTFNCPSRRTKTTSFTTQA